MLAQGRKCREQSVKEHTTSVRIVSNINYSMQLVIKVTNLIIVYPTEKFHVLIIQIVKYAFIYRKHIHANRGISVCS